MATPLNSRPARGLDIEFSVPFTHRLRFTDDVLGGDAGALFGVLEGGDAGPARVQVWIDRHVAGANPGLADRFTRLLQSRPGDVTPAGPPRLIDGGEGCKNDPAVIGRLLGAIHDAGLDRRSYVVAVGGGAVLDAVGYAAALAHRGIRLVRLPTTTLAQADSGVGVKNAVNLFGKKNWVGTFAVPWAVVNDAALLATLPDRDFRCGFAEAVKVFLLKSGKWFARLCEAAGPIRGRDMGEAGPVIAASAECHLRHITHGGDPFEALEARPLDFGHWSAHKLEVMSGFGVRHGEAVSVGVALDVAYSTLAHGLPERDGERALRCLRDLGLPVTDRLLLERAEEVFDGLEEFRQHLGGRLTVTMLEGVGRPVDVHEIDRRAMREAAAKVADFAGAG